MYRQRNGEVEIFLCHPGGPFYKNKDLGVWTMPKGEFNTDEDPLNAAKREFEEETGMEITGHFVPLTPVRYKGGAKIVYAWAVKGDIDEAAIHSNSFSLEWPPKSGKFIQVPEVDRGEWFSIHKAREKILPSLSPFIDDFVSNVIGN